MALNNEQHFSQIETRLEKIDTRLAGIEKATWMYIGGIAFWQPE